MDYADAILGTATTTTLKQQRTEHVLKIGSDGLTRSDLARVECFNFRAARNLTDLLNQQFKVTNVRDVFERVSPNDLAIPRLGAISLAVLGAAFEAKRLGGSSPLHAWVRKHLPEDAKITTFDTLKHREQAEARAEAKARKARKHARRNQAHKTRVDRFLAPAETAAPTP